MGFCFNALIYFFLFTGVHCADRISWLPCQFTDENVTINATGHVDMKHIYRQVVLQFGLKEDPPVNPDVLTFLITPSKLNIRRSLAGVEEAELTCSLARYSTDGSHVRWPVRGEHEYNRWFTLHINHSKKKLSIMAFLRQSTDQPPTGQDDYKSWAVIKDKEVLITSVVMVLQTLTPVVKSPLKSQPKLHCQFDVDHKAPDITVRWHKLKDSNSLFKYSSQSERPEGSGVSLKQLAAGGATYTIPNTSVSSEGTYMCSMNVHPLQGSVAVELQIEEPPRVSLNVDSSLTLSEGDVKAVQCVADGYYPLDVDILWSHQGITDVGPRLKYAKHSRHFTNKDGTYKKRGFFSIYPKLMESGQKFTCSVSHKTLSEPIRRTFTLVVTEPGRRILIFYFIISLVFLVLVLRYCLKGKKHRVFYSLWLWFEQRRN